MIRINLINSRWTPNDGQYKSQIVLTYDEWNDYGYKTSFCMYYCDKNGTVHEIGAVKIYYIENDIDRKNSYYTHTRECLGQEIEYLSEDFCSLGQDLKYYESIKRLFPKEMRWR